MYTKIKYDVRKANSLIFFFGKKYFFFFFGQNIVKMTVFSISAALQNLRFSNANEGTILFHLYSPSLASTVVAHFLDL